MIPPSPPSGPSATDVSCPLAEAWRERLQACPPAVLALLSEQAQQSLAPLADLFYDVLERDPRALRFLSHAQVGQQLKPALQRWLAQLLTATPDQVDALMAGHRHVGQVHARIGVPVDLVTRGIRILRQQLGTRIAARPAAPEHRLAAIGCLDLALDLALEGMTLAYTSAHDRATRTDAAYRLFTLVQNAAAERERQRALLLDWENNLLYRVAGHLPWEGQVPHLSASAFGLWYTHKAIPSFGDSPETERVQTLIDQVDQALDRLRKRQYPAERARALSDIREYIGTIRQLLAMLFERTGELEAGSDTLTHLLNRRFLPTVLRREIELADQKKARFAVALLDLDHFKRINDDHGHDAGDRALQLVAHLLNQHTRGSDYVFRMGGEEFLLVLVAVDESQACAIAEGLRRRIEATAVVLADGSRVAITASIGVALYEGHPDYEQMLNRADAAMYRAKREGRNQVMLAPPGPAPKRPLQARG